MSTFSARTSTIFPFPSSPHCEPTITTQFPLLISPDPKALDNGQSGPSDGPARERTHASAAPAPSLRRGARIAPDARRSAAPPREVGPRFTHPVEKLRGRRGGCQHAHAPAPRQVWLGQVTSCSTQIVMPPLVVHTSA